MFTVTFVFKKKCFTLPTMYLLVIITIIIIAIIITITITITTIINTCRRQESLAPENDAGFLSACSQQNYNYSYPSKPLAVVTVFRLY